MFRLTTNIDIFKSYTNGPFKMTDNRALVGGYMNGQFSLIFIKEFWGLRVQTIWVVSFEQFGMTTNMAIRDDS